MANPRSTTAVPLPYVSSAMDQFVPEMPYQALNIARPLRRIGKTQGTLPQVTRESLMGDAESTTRAPGTNYDRVDTAIKGVEWKLVNKGKEAKIPDESRQEFVGVWAPELSAAKKCKNDILVDVENEFEALFMNTTTWTGAALFTDVSAAPWDAAGSDAIGHIKAAMKQSHALTGMMPNALILDWIQFDNLITKNTAIKALIGTANTQDPTAILAALKLTLGIKHIIPCGAVYNSAIKGQAAVGSYIWSDDYAMVAKIAETDDPTEPCIARTILGVANNTDVQISRYREEQCDSDIVKAKMQLDQIITDAAFGHLLQVD